MLLFIVIVIVVTLLLGAIGISAISILDLDTQRPPVKDQLIMRNICSCLLVSSMILLAFVIFGYVFYLAAYHGD